MTVIPAFAMCVLCRAQPATSLTTQELADLFEAAWRSGEVFAVPDRVQVRYEVIDYPRLSDREIETIAERIANRPDHPDRLVLEQEQRRRREPDTTQIVLWHIDASVWRLNRDEAFQGVYVDIASNKDVLWSLTPFAVQLLDADRVAPPNRNLASVFGGAVNEIRRFAWGPWGDRPFSEITVRDISVSGTGAQFTYSFASGATLRAACMVRSTPPRLLPTTVTLLQSPSSPDSIGQTWVWKDWEYDPVLGVERAGVIEHRDLTGRLLRSTVLLNVSALDDANALLFDAPRVGNPDAVRGIVPIQNVLDFRSGKEVVTTISPSGATSMPLPESMKQQGRPFPWRAAGWLLAGIIAAALIGTKIVLSHRRDAGASRG